MWDKFESLVEGAGIASKELLGLGARFCPETLAGNARALRHRAQLHVNDIGVNRPKSGKGAEPAVRPGNDALSPNDICKPADPLGDQ